MKNKWLGWMLSVFLAVLLGMSVLIFHQRTETFYEKLSQYQNQMDSFGVCLEQIEAEVQEMTYVPPTEEPTEVPTEPVDDTFDYLAIGNSITTHGICDYWWSDCGMAASKPENDYYHLLVKELEAAYLKVEAKTLNLSAWETLYTDRAEMTHNANFRLSEKLDLVTVQLGENVSELSTFESDLCYLIAYIQTHAPKAKIVLIGDFWYQEVRGLIKERVAKASGVLFADLSEIVGKEEYRCGSGTVVYDAKGNPHEVTHPGVALHPGDLGMAYIAESVLDVLELKA